MTTDLIKGSDAGDIRAASNGHEHSPTAEHLLYSTYLSRLSYITVESRCAGVKATALLPTWTVCLSPCTLSVRGGGTRTCHTDRGAVSEPSV